MVIYQLANYEPTYGPFSGWFLVTSDCHEVELAGPFETEALAQAWIDMIRRRQDFELMDESWRTTS